MVDPYGERSFEKGKKVAFESGAEYQANPGSSMKDYRNDAAIYFRNNVKTFEDLTKEEKTALTNEFSKGIRAEKNCQ